MRSAITQNSILLSVVFLSLPTFMFSVIFGCPGELEERNSETLDSETFVPEIELAYVSDFEWVWWDHLSEGDSHVTFFKPILPPGFHAFGHFAQPGLVLQPNGYMLVARALNQGTLQPPEALVYPKGYQNIWNTSTSYPGHPVSVWKPIPPNPNYVCLGLVTKYGILSEPGIGEAVCARKDLTVPGSAGDQILPGTWLNIPDRIGLQVNGKYGVYIGTFTGSDSWSDLTNTLDSRYVKRDDMAPEDVDQLVQQYGPVIYHHPLEIYFPDDPEYVLDSVDLCYGVMPADPTYDNFLIEHEQCVQTSKDTLINDFVINVTGSKYYNDSSLSSQGKSFEYWLKIPIDMVNGNINRAKSIIKVLPMDVLFTDIQFWMFYPFNGPGRMRIGAAGVPFNLGIDVHLTENGRHYGDWEHITLRFLNSTKELVAVYMSRHSQGQWFSKNYFDYTLHFSGFHPIVYSAKYSHAFYNAVYDHINYHVTYSAIANVWLWDHTGIGEFFNTFEPGNYEIVHSGTQDVPNLEPWLDFDGRWGQNEKLSVTVTFFGNEVHTETELGRGPTAPATKDDWKYGDPDHDWHWQVEVSYK